MMFHVLTLATRRSCFLFALGRSPPVCLHSMDTILRLLEGLRRDEIAWLNTYLTGRLRAMPPPATAAATAQVSAVPAHAGIAGDSVEEVPVAALAERVGDFNISMDPWEQTGAAPQGWASHLHQTVIPVQGYVQLRPHDTTLPSFGGGPPATAGTANETILTEVAIREGGGKASPSVSIFSRAPLCPNTCRHCRNKPCDIATDHDDHICYNCEQYCFLNVFRSGRRRSCPFATYGAWSVLLNDAALGALINITYACSVNDEELFSSPPLGARTHGLPMMTDWKSLSASSVPSIQMFFAMESGIFGQWLSPDETCLGMYDCVLLISGYWAMWWRRSTERVRTVSLSRFTSVLAMVFCLVVGVGFVFGLCFLALVVLVLLCLGFRLCTICSVIHKL